MVESDYIAATEGNIALDVIFQNWIMSVIGDKIESQFVRPAWQPFNGGYPDIGINWCSFGFRRSEPDVNGQMLMTEEGEGYFFRHETLDVLFSFFGEDGQQLALALRDGLTLWQNRVALEKNGIDLLKIEGVERVPELVNQQWQNRIDLRVKFRRNSITSYNVGTIKQVSMTINGEVQDEWQAGSTSTTK